MKNYFLPRADKERLLWIKNFSSKLTNYTAKYGITAAQVTDMVQSTAFFDWIMNAKNIISETSTKFTSYKNEVMEGVKAGSLASTIPAVPVLAAMPTVVAPDIFGRATSIANAIKVHKDYTEADGRDLGLEGAEITQDFTEMKPILTITLNAGKPQISWKKNKMSALEVLVDRGSGEYVFMTIATKTSISESHPLPTNGAQLWKYKAIYRYDDEQVGQWSDEVSIRV